MKIEKKGSRFWFWPKTMTIILVFFLPISAFAKGTMASADWESVKEHLSLEIDSGENRQRIAEVRGTEKDTRSDEEIENFVAKYEYDEEDRLSVVTYYEEHKNYNSLTEERYEYDDLNRLIRSISHTQHEYYSDDIETVFEYYDNGSLLSETSYRNGYMWGYADYYSNGQLRTVMEDVFLGGGLTLLAEYHFDPSGHPMDVAPQYIWSKYCDTGYLHFGQEIDIENGPYQLVPDCEIERVYDDYERLKRVVMIFDDDNAVATCDYDYYNDYGLQKVLIKSSSLVIQSEALEEDRKINVEYEFNPDGSCICVFNSSGFEYAPLRDNYILKLNADGYVTEEIYTEYERVSYATTEYNEFGDVEWLKVFDTDRGQTWDVWFSYRYDGDRLLECDSSEGFKRWEYDGYGNVVTFNYKDLYIYEYSYIYEPGCVSARGLEDAHRGLTERKSQSVGSFLPWG